MPRICFFSASSHRPRKPLEIRAKTEIECAVRIGMFVQTAKQFVLTLLVQFHFFAEPEIDADL